MEVSRKITKLYASMESMEASLGGGGGFEGFYGSVTANGVSRVYESMSEHCAFGKDSFLVDIGGGVGRPLVHALVQPGVKTAVGLELDEIKCLKSESVIRESFTVARQLAGDECVEPRVIHRDIEKVNSSGTLDPATHAYAFWEGIPVKARTAFGELFAKSSTLTSVAIVQRAIRRQSPAELMAELKFGSLLLVDTLKGIHMSGSNRSFTAYVFERMDPPGQAFKGSRDALLSHLLTAPRLLQTSLPRMLRRRNPNPAYSSTASVHVTAASKAKGARRGRVALADTMPQLRTAAPACTDAADQEAAQAGVGQAQWREEPQPADEPNGAQDCVDAESKPHRTDPERSRCPCAHAGTDQTGRTAPPGPEEARDAGKTSARCRNSREQQRQPQLKHEAGGAPGRTRSACADLSNKAVPHSSSDDLPGDLSKAQSASSGRSKNCGNLLPSGAQDSGKEYAVRRAGTRSAAAAADKGSAGPELCSSQLSPSKRDAHAEPLPASPTKRSCADQGQACA